MAEPICEDEGLLQEWSPLTQLVQQIPLKVPKGLFSQNLNLTCLDVISEYIALGTNSSLVYWYSRASGELQRLRLENSHSEVTCVKVVSTVDYMVAAGTSQGTVTVFQIPKLVPESIPDQFKPKKRQIERFSINGLHYSPVTNIEWSQNGMKLFSGDKNGVVVLTEIDFSLHLSKSVELINEHFEIIQLSYAQQMLLISTIYRSITCDGTNNWRVCQVGTKERKILGKFGATFCKFDQGLVLYASRPGYRLWLADKFGVVRQTLIFKSAVQSTCPKIQLINPINKKEPYDTSFGKVIQFGDKLLTYNSEVLYVLHPGAVSVVSVLSNVRKILDLAVSENEIFILEGERSLLRISPIPDKYSLEIMYNSMTRKTAFNLDELAARLKDTAVGSIKKITRDLIILPQQVSPNSPPALADEAIELPPIVYLPNGTMPSLFSENVEIQSFVEDNKQFKMLDNMNCHGQSSDPANKGLNASLSQDCHEEVISRPLRKKRNKIQKNLMNSQILESESDTTSNTSDDRLTCGIANDLSLSDESAMSQSYSSFSVLRDISTLMNQPKDNLKTKDGGNDEFVGASDGKSQTSLDTCESVSECMITSSEKFREEQEKTFARLVNQSLLDSFNSEKTDNMSISLNMTTSSSVSSKISGNLQTTSDCSEHSSMMSRPKTTELPTDDDIENQEECTPINVNYIMSTNNFEGCDLPYQERKEIGSSESLASGGNDQKEPFYPRRSLGQSESENTEETFQINRFSPIRSQILMHETNNIKDDKCRELCCLASDTENNEENYRLDFGINSLSEFYAKEHLEEIKSSEKTLQTSQLNDKNININDMDRNREQEKQECELTNSSYSANEPLSYGPPSGSSQTSLRPSLEFPSLGQSNCPFLNWQASLSSDHWPQHKTPELVTSLAVSKNYVLCTDINDNVYYSDLCGLALTWVLLDYKASAVKISNDGSVVWLQRKKSVFFLVNPSKKGPFAGTMEEIASSVIAFDVDNKNNDGWLVTARGQIIHARQSSNTCSRKEEKVPCQGAITDVACCGGVVVLLTRNGTVLGKFPNAKEFKIIKTSKPLITSIALGCDSILWVVDDKNVIYFSDDFLYDSPQWWQIQISDYIFPNSTTFQNIYSKIKLNNLKANIHMKTTCIASNENSVWIYDRFASTVRVNKSDFTGYMWKKDLSVKSLPSIQWQTLSGEGVFEDKGHVWLLSTDGNIFCTSPKTNQFQTISVPCADEVICIASSSDTFWVLSESGRVYSRLGLKDGNLSGNSWRELKLPQIDNLRLVWVSCGCDVAWGCDIHGRTFITIGSPHHMATNIFDAAWLEVEGGLKGVQFEKVFVGPQLYMVWAIDVKGNLYVREGIFSHYQIGTSWVYVGGIEAVHVSISGTSVWALATNGNIYRRCGISEKNYIGDYWKSIPGTFKVITSSFTDELWGITHNNEIMRLSYCTKILGSGKLEGKQKETYSSKEDVSWEIVE